MISSNIGRVRKCRCLRPRDCWPASEQVLNIMRILEFPETKIQSKPNAMNDQSQGISFDKFTLEKFFPVFAFGRSYSVLFVARALQGVGSSCSSVSGKHLQLHKLSRGSDLSGIITQFKTNFQAWECWLSNIRTTRKGVTRWASLSAVSLSVCW